VLVGNEAIKWSITTMETRAIPDAVASALLVLITAMFVAVAANGQICRSTNGISTTTLQSPKPTETGFTLIAADPFGGLTINRIMSGAIGSDLYWVAVGSGGVLFTSTDAGVNWTERTTGTTANLTALAYNVTHEQFFAGGGSGDFLVSDTGDGTTWTLDTTLVQGIISSGSGNIHTAIWDTGEGLWQLGLNASLGVNNATYTMDETVAALTLRENIYSNHTEGTVARKLPSNGNILLTDSADELGYFSSASDTVIGRYTDSYVASPCTAIGTAAGTGTNTDDVVVGRSNGTLENYGHSGSSGPTLSRSLGVMGGRVQGIAFSSVSNRWIAVSLGGDIKYLESEDFLIDDRWGSVTNPFTADIIDIWYDPSDDIFIAVGSNGQIGRSVDGIS
jgi:hypothetical protein